MLARQWCMPPKSQTWESSTLVFVLEHCARAWERQNKNKMLFERHQSYFCVLCWTSALCFRPFVLFSLPPFSPHPSDPLKCGSCSWVFSGRLLRPLHDLWKAYRTLGGPRVNLAIHWGGHGILPYAGYAGCIRYNGMVYENKYNAYLL